MTTRDKEIKQHATDISNTWLPQDYQQVAYDAAIKMAEWADQHPRKGLWDSEKVISFLKEHATVENSSNINIHINGATYHFVNDFIEDLRKAMED